MKDIARKTVARTKKFVEDHRVGLAFMAGASIGVALNKVALKSHDNFLKEHGLYDEFYTVSDDE